MDPVGIAAVGLVLVAGVGGGAWWKRTNGRLRDVAPAPVDERAKVGVAVDERGKMSDPAASLVPTRHGVGEVRGAREVDQDAPVDGGREVSDRGAVIGPTQEGVGVDVGALDPALLAGLGVDLADRVTLLQFSSAVFAPCRAVSRISSEVAGEVPGVRHVEVDAEQHLDAVKALGIWRTPTLLVLDGGGRVVKRATGVPKKPQLIAAVRETL